MLTYVTRRLIQSVVILFGLSIVFFWLLHVSPGGPCDSFSAAGSSPSVQERYQACVQRLGLNEPLPSQYVKWLSHAVRGDFGVSNQTGESVSGQIIARAPATLLLSGIAYLVTELIAIPLGIFAALRRYSFFDSLFTVGSYAGLALPTFWVAGLVISIFAVNLGLLPAGGIVGDTSTIPTFNGPGYWSYFFSHPWHAGTDLFGHLILPAAVLAITAIAIDSRFMRASMLEVIHQDYIRTARAKGLPPRTVVLKHAVRNALLPIITNVALAVPSLIGGAVITETIFGWPGMGLLFIDSLGAKNYPVIQALLMLGALGILVGNIAADITYALVDPRIRYD